MKTKGVISKSFIISVIVCVVSCVGLSSYAQEGSFHISQWNGNKWEEMYHPQFQVKYSTQEFKFKPVNSQVKLRISQTGLPFADIDQIKLRNDNHDVTPDYAIQIGDNQSVIDDILEIDYDVVLAHKNEIEIAWKTSEECREATLFLNANEYDDQKGPLTFPPRGYVKYEMGSNMGSIVVDGDISETDGTEPLYSPFWQPTTGHPDGNTYIYICDDVENVYFSLDVTADNTDDYGADWAEITISASNGTEHSFYIDDFEQTWGKTALGRTSKVPYKHQAVEFRIPKTIVGDGDIDFKLQYYGTSAITTDLAITKDDGVTSIVQGGSTTYTIVATNNGPGNDTSVNVIDNFPAALTSVSWTSVASSGATGNTVAGSGNINELLSMPVGSSVAYTVSCNISGSATGSITNTATVTASVFDPTPGNDSATDIDMIVYPEIDVQRPPGTARSDGSSDYVGWLHAGTIRLDYTIYNPGTSQLSVSSIDGENFNPNVTNLRTTTPLPLQISAGTTDILNVSFDIGTGFFSFDLDINNNDSNEDPYDIRINGAGRLPEINVKYKTIDIPDGGSYNFGSHDRGSQTDWIFTIENTGMEELTLNTPLSLGGANTNQFSITAQPSSPVAIAVGSTYFTVRFSPTDPGLQTATMAIGNNDTNENPYNLTLKGTGLNKRPGISVIHNQTINEDDTTDWLPFTLTDADDDPASLLVSAGSDNQDLLPNSKIIFKGTGANRFIQVIPSPDSSGSGTVHVTVRDQVDQSTKSFRVTVLPVNDPPQFVSPLVPITLVQGASYTIPIALLYPLVTDPDDPAESLIWGVSDTDHFSPLITSASISFTAPTDWAGTEILTVTISDGDLSDSTPLTVTVTATADVTPPASPTNLTATPGPTYVELAWDANTEADIAAYVVFRDPASNIFTEGRIDTVFHPTTTYRDEGVPVGTTLTYRVTAVDASGNESDPSDPADAIIETGIEEQTTLPTDFVLYQNHPNPFNPVTAISYTLPRQTHVKLAIYDMQGRLVAILENGTKSAGFHTAGWDATHLGTGIYFYRITTPEFTAIRKCMLVK